MIFKNKKSHILGFTLLEMLLVLAISSSLILLLINFTTQKMEEQKREKTVLQMQQILSSAISYYVNNSEWPLNTGDSCDGTTWTDVSTITSNNFNTNYIYGFRTNPYGQAYYVSCTQQKTDSGGNFYVATNTNTPKDSMIVASKLPMAFINSDKETTQTDTDCSLVTSYEDCKTAVASINIPGQNLNNARSINFMGLYYSGSCVPAPSCPSGMKASIIVSPAAIAGVNDVPTSCTGNSDPSQCDINVYPISSFGAYARGKNSDGDPGDPGSGSLNTNSPYVCDLSSTTKLGCVADETETSKSSNYSYWTDTTTVENNTEYWRVCLSVVTEKGTVSISSSSSTFWRQQGKALGQIAAFTRCVPNDGSEAPAGSSSVFQPS